MSGSTPMLNGDAKIHLKIINNNNDNNQQQHLKYNLANTLLNLHDPRCTNDREILFFLDFKGTVSNPLIDTSLIDFRLLS